MEAGQTSQRSAALRFAKCRAERCSPSFPRRGRASMADLLPAQDDTRSSARNQGAAAGSTVSGTASSPVLR